MSSSVHANSRTKNILILGEGFTQGSQHFMQKKSIRLILVRLKRDFV